MPLARLAVAWVLNQPAVTAPIVGATRVEHIDDAAKATNIELSADELAALAKPYVPHPVLGHS